MLSKATATRKLVVLDRDGVINRDSDAFIKNPDEWQPLPGSLDAIAKLSRADFAVAVATNQSGVGRGLLSADDLRAIHAKMERMVEQAGGRLAGIFFCPHAPGDGCDCRKPRPGLLRQIESAFDVTLTGVPVVGDSGRDLEAALAVGAKPVLVRTGNGDRTLVDFTRIDEVAVFDDLTAVANYLIDDQG